MRERLATECRQQAPVLAEWRRYLHARPELSFEEYETTAWLAAQLEQWGIPYSRPTPTGLVGVVEGSMSGPTIAVRGDIDALPIMEETRLPFASTRPGVMHACGHDGHTAILLGLARFLSANRGFPGRVKLLFQPAEEKPPGGAKGFIATGVLEGVTACIGLHLMSDTAVGKACIAAGPTMANSDGFTVRIQGKGGHGASPHQTVDAIMVACNAVVNLQTVVSRKVDPLEPAVVTVGAIHAGAAFNIIADTAEIKGTLRSFSTDVRKQLQEEVRRTLEATCSMYGATFELTWNLGYPALVNHPEITAVLRSAAEVVLGAENVFASRPTMGGEDFAYYADNVPAAFLWVGARNPAVGACWEHHHPKFTVDEAALPLGLEILGRATLDLLGLPQ
ncbi:MAG TPA: amidohydrolase [Symbiobacteriaceae bacterium]|nr:amidohydrolase [Symbiobacteriaceae bacterium]